MDSLFLLEVALEYAKDGLKISILILMDSLFLLTENLYINTRWRNFNPYFNGFTILT